MGNCVTNGRFYRTSCLLAAAGLAAAVSGAAAAAPTNILTLGDSISDGNSATNGYQYYLQDLFVQAGLKHGVHYDFIGGQIIDDFDTPSTVLSDGTTPFDADGWGRDGYLAASSPDGVIGLGIRQAHQSLAYDLHNNTIDVTTDENGDPTFVANRGVFTNDTGSGRAAAVADVILLQIGTNAIWSDDPDDDLNNPSPLTEDALDQFGTLLTELRAQWDAGNIASDAKILVAQIMPKGSRGSGNLAVNDDTVRNSAVYNANLQAVIDALPDSDADDIAFKNLFVNQLVDMFQIEATQGLADSLGVPITDINIDGDQWVDWIEVFDGSTNIDFDESSPIFSNVGGDPVEENPNILTGGNDLTHPTDLGYNILAHQWYNALLAEGIVPEPGSMALLGLGGLALLRRRRA